MDLFYLIFGLAILVGAGDSLVRGAVAVSLRFGIPAIIVSATIVAIGTSAPELLIGIKAALEDAPGIALGNVVGSNIANVLLVLGVPAIIAPMAACGTDAHRNCYFMIAATVLFSGMVLTGTVSLLGGLVLVVLALVMVADSLRLGLHARAEANVAGIDTEAQELAELEDADPEMAPWKITLLILAGVIGLPLGADFLVSGARGIALSIGISETVIGLTLVAIGTSLPELATTVVAAMRRQADVAIGNVIGSNIFNVTAIAGAAAIVTPLEVPYEILTRDIWVMIAASALLLPFVLRCKPIGRLTGVCFLAAYAIYLYIAFV
ncbi:MAG: calcium/sodium antiporter [Pseudomonadota bacterium]